MEALFLAGGRVSEPLASPPIPTMRAGQTLNIGAVRDELEITRRNATVIVGLVITLLLSVATFGGALIFVAAWFVLGLLNEALTAWIFYWALYGNAVLVGEHQYPELNVAVQKACEFLDLRPVPKVMVLHGGGTLALLIVKTFRRRGVLIFTSEMVDAMLYCSDSRQLMMIIGTELGHLKAEHYKFNFFLHYLGRLAYPLYCSYRRAAVRSADSIGLLVCGSSSSAWVAMSTLLVGRRLAKATQFEAIAHQEEELSTSFMAWWLQVWEVRPHMVRRMVALARFEKIVSSKAFDETDQESTVGLFPPQANVFNITIGTVLGSSIIGDNGAVAHSH